MQDQTKQISRDEDHQIERAIVLQTLCDDHDDGWPRGELAIELGDADQTAVDDALTRLKDEGVIELAEETVGASRATMRLNALGLIAV